MPRIAIIGSGPTAIYTAKYLLSSERTMAITMFETQAEAGKGTPYHQDWNEKEMLANIASIEIPPVTETLVSFLSHTSDEALASIGISRGDITERSFFPRIALGEYFKTQLARMVQQAEARGCTLCVKPRHTVQDVMMTETGVRLIVQTDTEICESDFDYVVMATGHVWPKNTEIKPGYFLSPWPASSLRTIGDCAVGIRGTSLSAIDAAVALSIARGRFQRDEHNVLRYVAEPGTEGFHITMVSRKGILPEADFYYPIPYKPLDICTAQAMKKLLRSGTTELLDGVYALFKAELIACDPHYAETMQLAGLSLEQFGERYFREREQHDPFLWAKHNLAEAKANERKEYTVAWRYAILRMHEVIAPMVPKFSATDNKRFSQFLKHIFVDDYATVPHESIERMLALHEAGKLEIMRLGDDYMLDTQTQASGILLSTPQRHIYFPAFIEAMGQRPLSAQDFPFKSLWRQGLVENATAALFSGQRGKKPYAIGGIDLDVNYHPVSDSPHAARLYCLSLPFMLGQFPFAQGITSSHAMGKTVAEDIVDNLSAIPMGSIPCTDDDSRWTAPGDK